MKKIYPTPSYYEEKTEEFIFSKKVYFTIDKKFSNEGFKKLSEEMWYNFTSKKSELVLTEKSNMRNSAVISTSENIPVNKLWNIPVMQCYVSVKNK